ncbi:MAG: imidazole glycerol phosphate synthase subunit HisH [Gammaproteobacteria bacterium]|jgi:glutamine amidotransferase
MSTIAVIDYGMGNLHSVAKALASVTDVRIEVTHDAETILRADRIVLPGVGAIRDCMAELKRLGLDDVIHEVAKTKPFLGVCVGMQALMDHSEENDGTRCLGIFSGTVKSFGKNLIDPVTNERLKVPHMGWNQVDQVMKHPLWKDIAQDTRFYFVHSFYVEPSTPDPIAGSTVYGHPFTSALAQDNVFAVQFHPEKSHHAGLMLYRNFVHWDGEIA